MGVIYYFNGPSRHNADVCFFLAVSVALSLYYGSTQAVYTAASLEYQNQTLPHGTHAVIP